MISAAVASGLFSTGSGLLGGIFDSISANRQYKNQVKLQDKMFNQQRQLINEQNEYNTPLNQMQRAKDAGVNPYFALGGAASGNQSSSGSVPSMPQSVPDGLSAFMSRLGKETAYLDLAQKVANVQKTKAETDNLHNTNNIQQFQLDNIMPLQVSTLSAENQSAWIKAAIDNYDKTIRSELFNIEQEYKRRGMIANSFKAKGEMLESFLRLRANDYSSEQGMNVENWSSYNESVQYPDNWNDLQNGNYYERKFYQERTESNYLVEHFDKWSQYDDAVINHIYASMELLHQKAVSTAIDQKQALNNLRFQNSVWDFLLKDARWKAANSETQNQILQVTVDKMYQELKKTEKEIEYMDHEQVRRWVGSILDVFKTVKPF